MILYSLYKSIVMVLPFWFYGFFNGYSAALYFDEFVTQMNNLLFTSLPPGKRAALDIDVHPDKDGPAYEKLQARLYYVGQEDRGLNRRVFFIYVMNGFFHAAIIYFIPKLIYYESGIIS